MASRFWGLVGTGPTTKESPAFPPTDDDEQSPNGPRSATRANTGSGTGGPERSATECTDATHEQHRFLVGGDASFALFGSNSTPLSKAPSSNVHSARVPIPRNRSRSCSSK